MLIGGLWHGADIKFIIWGGLNGLGLIFYKHWRKISPYENWSKWPARIIKITITFTFITFTRVFFIADTQEIANKVLYQIYNNFDPNMIVRFYHDFQVCVWLIVIGMIIHWLPSSVKSYVQEKFIYLRHDFFGDHQRAVIFCRK